MKYADQRLLAIAYLRSAITGEIENTQTLMDDASSQDLMEGLSFVAIDLLNVIANNDRVTMTDVLNEYMNNVMRGN